MKYMHLPLYRFRIIRIHQSMIYYATKGQGLAHDASMIISSARIRPSNTDIYLYTTYNLSFVQVATKKTLQTTTAPNPRGPTQSRLKTPGPARYQMHCRKILDCREYTLMRLHAKRDKKDQVHLWVGTKSGKDKTRISSNEQFRLPLSTTKVYSQTNRHHALPGAPCQNHLLLANCSAIRPCN